MTKAYNRKTKKAGRGKAKRSKTVRSKRGGYFPGEQTKKKEREIPDPISYNEKTYEEKILEGVTEKQMYGNEETYLTSFEEISNDKEDKIFELIVFFAHNARVFFRRERQENQHFIPNGYYRKKRYILPEEHTIKAIKELLEKINKLLGKYSFTIEELENHYEEIKPKGYEISFKDGEDDCIIFYREEGFIPPTTVIQRFGEGIRAANNLLGIRK